jgi:hypothetical protein
MPSEPTGETAAAPRAPIAVPSAVAGPPAAAHAVEQLIVVIDRSHKLYASTTVTNAQIRELTFGDNREALATFAPIEQDALAALVAAALRANPSTPLTLWIDPNAKPLGWPQGWQADTDLLDPGVYLQMLVDRARRDAGISPPSTGRTSMLSLPFPPAVPLKVGSHSRTAQ